MYDTIILGSGLGGLSAGIYLQKEQAKTLILEKNPIPGGACQTIFLKDHQFDLTLHHLCSLRDKEPLHSGIQTLLKDLTLDQLDVTTAKDLGEVRWKGQEPLYLIADLPILLDQLKKIQGINLEKSQAWLHDFMTGPFSFYLQTVQEVFTDADCPIEIQKFLGAYWPYLGVPISKLNANHYFGLFRSLMSGGAHSLESADKLLTVLVSLYTKLQGDLRCKSKAIKIIRQSDSWEVYTKEDCFKSKNLICNISPEIFFNLLDFSKSSFDEKDLSVLSSLRTLTKNRVPAMPIWSLFLVLNKPQQFFNLTTSEQILYWTDNLDLCPIFTFNNSFLTPDEPVTRLNIGIGLDDSQALEFFSVKDLWKTDYSVFKKKLIDTYEDITGQKITPYIQESLLLTPVEYADYFGTVNGTGYGYRSEGWDQISLRTNTWYSEMNISQLAFAGGFCQEGNGYSHALLSGQTAARKILGTLRIPENFKDRELQQIKTPEFLSLYEDRFYKSHFLLEKPEEEITARAVASQIYSEGEFSNPIFLNKL